MRALRGARGARDLVVGAALLPGVLGICWSQVGLSRPGWGLRCFWNAPPCPVAQGILLQRVQSLQAVFGCCLVCRSLHSRPRGGLADGICASGALLARLPWSCQGHRNVKCLPELLCACSGGCGGSACARALRAKISLVAFKSEPRGGGVLEAILNERHVPNV